MAPASPPQLRHCQQSIAIKECCPRRPGGKGPLLEDQHGVAEPPNSNGPECANHCC